LEQSCKSGNIDRVAELLAAAPPEASDDNRFWRFKGWLHAARGELLPAEEAYQSAISKNPYDIASVQQLADVMRRLQKQNEADLLQKLAAEGTDIRRDLLRLPGF